jgi:hypothetical protein
MDCIFSEPLNFENTAPSDGQPFAYSKVNCETSQTLAEGAPFSFYIDKKISFGDVAIYSMLVIFCLIFLIKVVWNISHPYDQKI